MMWRSSDAMHSGEDLDIMSRWSSDEDQFLVRGLYCRFHHMYQVNMDSYGLWFGISFEISIVSVCQKIARPSLLFD